MRFCLTFGYLLYVLFILLGWPIISYMIFVPSEDYADLHHAGLYIVHISHLIVIVSSIAKGSCLICRYKKRPKKWFWDRDRLKWNYEYADNFHHLIEAVE